MTCLGHTLRAACLGSTMLAGAATAATLEVTVTNLQGEGGFSITPLYTAFHNGEFDAFDVGSAASAGLELIAETGQAGPGNQPGTIANERLAVDPNSTGGVIASADGPPPIQPGEVESRQFDVDTTNGAVFLTFLSMLLPSNDTFIGNDNAQAYQIFDGMGNFTGGTSITVTGNHIYDAGTEANDAGVDGGAAFLAGRDITQGGADGGVVTAGQSLEAFAGLQLATGDFLGEASILDFTSNPGAFNLLRIDITEVAPVPIPAGLPLLAAALGFLGLRSRFAKSSA